MVTCRDILNLNMDGVNLIAGEAGLNRMVSWVYPVQTKPYKDHMNQGLNLLGSFRLLQIIKAEVSFWQKSLIRLFKKKEYIEMEVTNLQRL